MNNTTDKPIMLLAAVLAGVLGVGPLRLRQEAGKNSPAVRVPPDNPSEQPASSLRRGRTHRSARR